MDTENLEAYLARIAVARPPALDAGTLRQLHHAHLLTVPFENLSIHLGERISLDGDQLLAKIVLRRRGGFCYELNGAFALLLEALGADVVRTAARVLSGDGLGPPFDHLALFVRLADGSGPWLVDVGFGSHSTYPLLLDDRREQSDPGGQFLVSDAPDGDIDVSKDGEPQYRIERRARSLADFASTCWWHQTSPDSHFTRGTVCSRLTQDGRVTISERTLILTRGRSRIEQELGDDDEVLAAYREHFGLTLDRVPQASRA